MATEYPALNRIHVVGYSANDTDYPILNLVADPRVAGYKVPEDFSACPDKRYPNHIFTGAQPISGDQRVRHTWEILPSPWVPFTRYDDDLGPIQGRRRSVKNEGQTASLATDKKVTYEAREGSAIVYTELEETWSIKTDDDGNSLFPVRVRDFYDASRGAVEESRQLIVPTGEEEGSLENIDGIITQTSYEAYNEFLSVKIVQKYKVDGPQLIGKTTNNDGQLVTITTQRKASKNYTPPSPTAIRTVEASREDAESVVEKITDAPYLFTNKSLSLDKPDVTPLKWKATIPSTVEEISETGTIQDPLVLESDEISKSEQQITEFVRRIRREKRDPAAEGELFGSTFTSELGGGVATVTEKYGTTPLIAPSFGTISAEKEALGDGKYVTREVVLSSPPELTGQEYDDQLDIIFPFTQKIVEPNEGIGDARTEVQPRDVYHSLKRNIDVENYRQAALSAKWITSEMIDISLPDKLLGVDVLRYIAKSTGSSSGLSAQNLTSSAEGNTTVSHDVRPNIINGYSGKVAATRLIFFLDKDNSSMNAIISKIQEISGINASLYPTFFTEPVAITLTSGSISHRKTQTRGYTTLSASQDYSNSLNCAVVNIPPTLHQEITINLQSLLLSNLADEPTLPDPISLDPENAGEELNELLVDQILTVDPPSFNGDYYPTTITATTPPNFPAGDFIVNVDSSSYRYGLIRVVATVAHITNEYV
jgi:hypothetical protein